MGLGRESPRLGTVSPSCPRVGGFPSYGCSWSRLAALTLGQPALWVGRSQLGRSREHTPAFILWTTENTVGTGSWGWWSRTVQIRRGQ